VILQWPRARRRRRARQRLKSFREPPTLVSGPESTSVIVAEASTASKDPTAGSYADRFLLQIRNVVRAAHALASQEGAVTSYSHLEIVIDAGKEYETNA
jgi:hypothetical protein